MEQTSIVDSSDLITTSKVVIVELSGCKGRPRRKNAGAGVDRLQVDFGSKSYLTGREFFYEHGEEIL